MPNKKYFAAFIICLILFSAIAILVFDQISITGDAISYINAINILSGNESAAIVGERGLAVHRILTTFLGLESILVLTFIFGSITTSWLIFDIFLYFLLNIIFYKLLLKIFKSPPTALIGGLFFASNYAMVTAGLGHFMDIGGWLFFTLSLYLLYNYIESGRKADLMASALAISVGGFFKENAFFGVIVLTIVLIYESFPSPRLFIKKIFLPAIIVVIPAAIHHLSIFFAFNQGYLDFARENREIYKYSSRIAEYTKSFGSLLNWLAPVSLAGLFVLLKSGLKRVSQEFGIDSKRIVFIIGVLASSVPALIWPAITQRILFMIVPGLVILACFFIKKYEKYWPVFLPVVALYAATSFLMDSFILDFVNLPF